MKDVYISREELYVPCPSPEYDVVFEKLMMKWWRPLLTYAYDLAKRFEVARELHTDAMAKMWRNRHKLARLYNFFKWAKQLMQRLYIDEMRRFWAHQKHIFDGFKSSDDDDNYPGELTIYSDRGKFSKSIQDALFVTQITSVLTDEERSIIRLTFEEQLSADDAAKELKISKPAFKSKLYRSLRKMKQVSGAVGCV